MFKTLKTDEKWKIRHKLMNLTRIHMLNQITRGGHEKSVTKLVQTLKAYLERQKNTRIHTFLSQWAFTVDIQCLEALMIEKSQQQRVSLFNNYIGWKYNELIKINPEDLLFQSQFRFSHWNSSRIHFEAKNLHFCLFCLPW